MKGELSIGGVVIGERDFFAGAKDAIAVDVLAFMAAEGGLEAPEEPNTELKKDQREEAKYLHEHLYQTLRGTPGMDPEKVEERHVEVAQVLAAIGQEAKTRSDLPENLVERVAAYVLLEMATVEAIYEFDLSTIVEQSNLTKGKKQNWRSYALLRSRLVMQSGPIPIKR